MSIDTLNKALRIMGSDSGPGGGDCAHGLRSTALALLNEEGAFDGDERHGEKSDGGATRWCGPSLARVKEQYPRHL